MSVFGLPGRLLSGLVTHIALLDFQCLDFDAFAQQNYGASTMRLSLPGEEKTMKKLIALTGLSLCLTLATPVSAESALSRYLDHDLLSSALSGAAETVLDEWLNRDEDADSSLDSSAVDDTSHDPLESYNRMMFRFNERLDEVALKPLAETYVEYTPDLLRAAVRNFFSNVGDVGVAANSALQGKVSQAMSDSSRVALNSLFGLGGVIDVASELELEKNNEDFGQTLGVWGVPEGPYIILPVLGPRTLRSAVGTAFDTYLQMETLGSISDLSGVDSVSGLVALNLVDQRTRLLGKEELLELAALDPYVYMRETYLAYRRCQVTDCDKIDYVPADPEVPSTNNKALEELDMLEELDLLEDLQE